MDLSEAGIDLADGFPKILDLRFVDDILLFALNAQQTIFMSNSLADELSVVGLRLNACKTLLLTNEAQPRIFRNINGNQRLQVKNSSAGHKWLGAILGVGHNGRTWPDVNYRPEMVSKVFFANQNLFSGFVSSMHSYPPLLHSLQVIVLFMQKIKKNWMLESAN